MRLGSRTKDQSETHPEPEKLTLKKRLLTADEAAAYLGIAVQTVRNWASTGKLPKVRAHGCLRFDIEALDRWIREHSEPERKACAWS